MRTKISPALTDLNRLSAIYDWIPNEHTIRPTAEDLEVKRSEMDRISRTWPSVKDYVVGEIFLGRTTEFIFEPSRFRYNLPPHSNHYILWSTVKPYWFTYDDHVINEQISMMIKNISCTNYQFAWYKNPKPTIIDFWHVQVFWIN